jgi:hypothetical protein
MSDVQMGDIGEAVFHGPGMAKLWNSAYRWGEGAFIGTGIVVAAPAAIEAAAAVPGVINAGVNRVMFGPALNRVFWSGAGYFSARAFAEMSEGSILETDLLP